MVTLAIDDQQGKLATRLFHRSVYVKQPPKNQPSRIINDAINGARRSGHAEENKVNSSTNGLSSQRKEMDSCGIGVGMDVLA